MPTEEDGYFIQSIVQDSLGFLWFGSLGGLHRYDGKKIITYTYDPLDDNSLANNFIECVFLDSKGLLWLAHTNSGLTLFNPAKENFIRYRHDPKDPNSLISDHVSVVVEDRQGYIWIGTNKGLDRFDRRANTFTHFRHDPADSRSLTDDFVRALYVDKQGTLWAGCGFPWGYPFSGERIRSSGGLNRYDPALDGFTQFFPDTAGPDNAAANRIRAIYEDSRGLFWIGTLGNGLYWLNREAGTFTRLSAGGGSPAIADPSPFFQMDPSNLENDGVSFIQEDHQGRLWIGTVFSGLYVFDPVTGLMNHFAKGNNRLSGLPTNSSWSFLQSRDHIIWIATGVSGGGHVVKVKTEAQPFNFHKNLLPGTDGLIMGIAEDGEGRVWQGIRDADLILAMFDRKTAKSVPWLRSTLPGPIFSVAVDSQGVAWAGSPGGFFQVDPSGGAYVRYQQGADSPVASENDYVENLFLDSRGLLWLATRGGGLRCYNPKTGIFSQFKHSPSDPSSIGGNMVRWVTEDRKGNIWVGGGCNCPDPGNPIFLDRFNPETASFTHFENSKDLGCAFNIMEDREGNIWYIDFLEGIRRLNPSTGSITKYTTYNSTIPSRNVRALAPGEDGKIWMATAYEIVRFDPVAETFFSYPASSGITGAELGWGAVFVKPGGEILFGAKGGFYSFFPDRIIKMGENATPRLAITGFSLMSQLKGPGKGSALRRPIWQAGELCLHYYQNSFILSLACIDFSDPDANYLEYKLENFDINWRNDLQDGDASYVNLPPGNYTFRVRGANSAGIWNHTGVSLRILILPPWWKTGWAYLSYLILFLAFVYIVYRFQLKRQLALAETRRLHELDAFKTRFYTNITHEFRTPLTVILGLAEQALDNSRQKREEAVSLIRRNGQHLLRLVNQMLELSKAESGTLKARMVQGDIVQFLKYSLESYHSWAEARQVELHFHSEVESLAMGFDPEKVQDILSNLLSNAFKATPPGGRITVRVEADEHFLSCAVEDTGHGIEKGHLPFIFDRFFSPPPPQREEVSSDIAATVEPIPPPLEGVRGRLEAGWEGTGIGLALTKELLHLLGGRIEVWSEPGRGSRFTFYLPIRRSANSPPQPFEAGSGIAAHLEPSPSPSGRAGEGLVRLLIIEDNADVVYYLRSCLQRRYEILVAADGQEGVELALQEVPDIIISDVMMPRRDGLEVCRILKADERTSHIPIILLTARAAIEDKIQGIRRGADAYLSKPFHREELDAQLEQLLIQRRRLQEHFRRPDAPPPGEAERPEAAFLQKVRACILEHLEEENFGVEELADALFLSRTQLFRKVKALTGRNVAAFIHQVRIGQAKRMLATTDLTVAEIAFQTGFSDPSYLRKVFLKETGETLADFRKRFRKG